MKRIRKAAPCVLFALWAVLLVPFFMGARAAHPATDDFTFAVYTHATWLETGSILHVLRDALSYALRTWRDWQGTVTGVIVMTLNPAVFSIETYGVHAVVLLALDLLALYVFLHHMLVRRLALSRSFFLCTFAALSLMQLLFLPDIVEGIYWFNGAWFYTGAQAVALLTLTACDGFSEKRAGAVHGALHGLLCVCLLFALGLDNYITAMMTGAVLALMAAQRLWAAHASVLEEAHKQRRAALVTALLLLPLALGLLLSVIAPGNSVRMETDGAHQSGMAWLLASVGQTMLWAVRYLVRFSVRTPLMGAVLLALPAAARRVHGEGRRVPPMGALAAGLYITLCAMIIPHMYSSGYPGSGRVVNMYHDYVLLALPLCVLLALMRLTPERRGALCTKRARVLCTALGVAALTVCLLGGQLGSYLKLVTDQMDGTQEAYIAQFQQEYALCEAAGAQDDVLLPPWTVQTVTGKSTAFADSTVWTNESMAQYFGVRSVRVQENPQEK